MSALAIEMDRSGIFLPRLQLRLDPREPQPGPVRCFISHAHSDHTGQHREVILSEPTSKLMRVRLAGEWQEHVLGFGERRVFSGAEVDYALTLLPAGHIFGSAMAWIEADGASLLYTGDFKMRPGMSAEPCEPSAEDILVMESTYGRPQYRFPPRQEILPGVIRFCREALDHDEVPVLLGYSLGKSQELLCCLAEAGLPLMLHGQVEKMTEVYRSFGKNFPAYERFDQERAAGKVLLCPPQVNRSAILRQSGKARVAVLTGWAVEPQCRYRYQADAAFPWSDHADYTELLEMVQKVAPKKIYTVHGFAVEFAQRLRALGYDAEALGKQEQLELPLGRGEVHSSAMHETAALAVEVKGAVEPLFGKGRIEGRVAPDSPLSFHGFASACARIGSTSKKLDKIQFLSEYLGTLDEDNLPLVITWFTGRPFPAVRNKVLQLGWALIRDALCAVGEMDQGEFGHIYLKHSDLGETAAEILMRNPEISSSLSIPAVQSVFEQLQVLRGPLTKLPVLVQALQQATPMEGKYLIKILTGDLRIGLKEGLVEESIAEAFARPLDDIKNANLLLGNVGETALLARKGALTSASLAPFRPVKYMLASPEKSAEDVWKRVREWADREGRFSLPWSPQSAKFNDEIAPPEPVSPPGEEDLPLKGGPALWIEDKYDGVRCQVHKVGTTVALYSRDLKEITGTFLDLADALREAPADFVMDGEIVAARGEQILPFSELQKRLGRREGDLFLGGEIPVRYVAFDLLWSGGETHLDRPLWERRKWLENLGSLPEVVWLARISEGRSAKAVEQAFEQARARGNEGLMIKDPGSAYMPGRRGLAWLKLKKAYATLDCVVVGAEYGHGKRKSVLSDYTFAVRDETTGELRTIGKAYSGLTDLEIARLSRHFISKAVRQYGRYFEVEPDTVLEIAFDALQKSSRHSSGLAMRFPRIIRIRSDKSAAEIDSLGHARKLVR